jgi:hypothetical protein
VLTGLVLAARRNLTGDRTSPPCGAQLPLHMLFYRGWLAAAIPLFGMFVFAIACVWVGLEQDRPY